MKNKLQKLKMHLCEFVGFEMPSKKEVECDMDSGASLIPRNTEKRREEAMEYLSKVYYETKIHEEEFRKRLEQYGRLRRWIYKRSRNLRDTGMIAKEIVAKPVGLAIVVFSGSFSLPLTISISPKVLQFIDSIFPFPYNKVIGVIVCFPIGFSPAIIATASYSYYLSKEIKKRLREDYGIAL